MKRNNLVRSFASIAHINDFKHLSKTCFLQKHEEFHQTVQFTDVKKHIQSVSLTSNIQFNEITIISLLLLQKDKNFYLLYI